MMTSKLEPFMNESTVWLQFKEGDKAAYESIYRSYSGVLFRYGCKIISDKELVKDCMHDLFTEIWRTRENLSNPVSVKNYLVKSLRNKLVREAAKLSKTVLSDAVDETAFTIINSPEFNLIDKQTKRSEQKQLIKALRGLTSKQKEVIFLLYYNNLSPAEVASIMSVSIRTIYNTAFSAIQSLRSELTAATFLVLLNSRFFE